MIRQGKVRKCEHEGWLGVETCMGRRTMMRVYNAVLPTHAEAQCCGVVSRSS